MLEEAILKLITAVEANTAALVALAGKAETPAKPTKSAPAIKSVVAAKPAPKAEEPTATAPTVGSMIEAMLKANKRKPAIALLATFKNADGKPGVKASDIQDEDVEAFIEQAQAILMGA